MKEDVFCLATNEIILDMIAQGLPMPSETEHAFFVRVAFTGTLDRVFTTFLKLTVMILCVRVVIPQPSIGALTTGMSYGIS